MPESRIEWGILGLGVVLLAMLGTIIGLNLGDDAVSGASAVTATEPPARETQPASPSTQPAATTTSA